MVRTVAPPKLQGRGGVQDVHKGATKPHWHPGWTHSSQTYGGKGPGLIQNLTICKATAFVRQTQEGP